MQHPSAVHPLTTVGSTGVNRTSMAEWLASSHPNPEQAWAEWQDRGIAVIPVGHLFGAVRIPEAVVYAAVESTDSDDVGVTLAQHLNGPVIHDARGRNYYVLVRPEARVNWGPAILGVEHLATHTHLGVPAMDRCEHTERTPIYWACPGIRPGHCDADATGILIRAGGQRLTEVTQ